MLNDGHADRLLNIFGRRTVEQISDVRACQLDSFFHYNETDKCSGEWVCHWIARPSADNTNESSNDRIEIVETVSCERVQARSTWQDRLVQLVPDNLIESSMFVLYRQSISTTTP
jgi:hypothetical protein